MGEIGLDRGRHDDRERGANAKLHAHRVGHVEDAEHLIEHRHDDRSAADAEQTGEQSGNNAADDDGQREPEQLGQRNAENHSFVIPGPRAARNPKSIATNIAERAPAYSCDRLRLWIPGSPLRGARE